MSLVSRHSEPMTVHKFIGDVNTPGQRHEPRDHMLCYMYKGENDPRLYAYPYQITFKVTIVNEDVTCKECLELLHS